MAIIKPIEQFVSPKSNKTFVSVIMDNGTSALYVGDLKALLAETGTPINVDGFLKFSSIKETLETKEDVVYIKAKPMID
jgi:hypothetical protein